MPHVLAPELTLCSPRFFLQRGKEEYKLAATSDGKEKKGKKGKGDKDMDDLKKEVDLVSQKKKKSGLLL